MAATQSMLNLTVGELVAQLPARARVFEQVGIDYCCGGRTVLAQACAARSLDPAQVEARLQAVGADHGSARYADVAPMTLTQVCDHIQATHHAYLRTEIPRLHGLLEKVVKAHGGRHPEVLEIQRVLWRFEQELASHMMKEESVLFPMIRRLDGALVLPHFHCGSIAAPIRVMETEHNDAGQALARLRQLSDDFTPPADACNTFRALYDGLREIEEDMHQHVHKENNVLFPRAVEHEAGLAAGRQG